MPDGNINYFLGYLVRVKMILTANEVKREVNSVQISNLIHSDCFIVLIKLNFDYSLCAIWQNDVSFIFIFINSSLLCHFS